MVRLPVHARMDSVTCLRLRSEELREKDRAVGVFGEEHDRRRSHA
jgi:hypothetical protein